MTDPVTAPSSVFLDIFPACDTDRHANRLRCPFISSRRFFFLFRIVSIPPPTPTPLPPMPFRLISRNLVGSCTSVPIPAAVLTITGRWTFSSRQKKEGDRSVQLVSPWLLSVPTGCSILFDVL